jgi:hypothetical protein
MTLEKGSSLKWMIEKRKDSTDLFVVVAVVVASFYEKTFYVICVAVAVYNILIS